jgi:hypothetical protein
MKKFKYWAAYLVVLTMIFTSCSKDGNDVATDLTGQDKLQLQFGTLLNDFNKSRLTKDHTDDVIDYDTPVDCNEGVPTVVLVALRDQSSFADPDDPNNLGPWVAFQDGDAGQFIEVGVKDNNGSWETTYSPDLELDEGDYRLEYFIVLDELGHVLWVAPRTGGNFAPFVPNPLPYDFFLDAGSKPYISVDVLCFDTRQEEAYGYPFFDINLIRRDNTYCIFVNYCDEETGREYPAKFMVDAWIGDGPGPDPDTPIVLDPNMNMITAGVNSPKASVFCHNLPPLANDDDTYYFEIRLLEDPLLGYVLENEVLRTFTVTYGEVKAQGEGLNPRFNHLFIDCEGDQQEDPCIPLGPEDDEDGDGRSDTIGQGTDFPCDVCPGYNDLVADANHGNNDGVTTSNECPDIPDDTTCQTAWMSGDTPFDHETFGNSRWGWYQEFNGAEGYMTKIMYAGQSIPVGDIHVETTATHVIIDIDEDADVTIEDVKISLTDTPPYKNNAGGFNYKDLAPSGDGKYHIAHEGAFYLMIHLDVCHPDDE